MATLIKLQKAFAPFSIEFPFPDDIPFTLVERRPYAFIQLHKVAPPLASPGKNATIVLRILSGVKTVEDVKAHFKLEHGHDVDTLHQPLSFKKIGPVLATEQWPWGMSATIDLGRAGFGPGSTYTYLLLDHALSCLYAGETFYLRFDWSQLKVTPV